MIHRENIEWRDIWVTGASNEVIPRALLVGDSIARSYFSVVEEELKGSFLCARMTSSTCVASPVMANELDLLLDEYRFELIHFNNGLHGLAYDEAEYARGLERVLDLFMKKSPDSAVIWASSTPVRKPDDLSVLHVKTDRVRERNRLARDIASARKLPINDLFAFVIEHPEYYSPDGVHFNAEGQKALGKQVASAVRAGAAT